MQDFLCGGIPLRAPLQLHDGALQELEIFVLV